MTGEKVAKSEVLTVLYINNIGMALCYATRVMFNFFFAFGSLCVCVAELPW
jgi:hypothetical protein